MNKIISLLTLTMFQIGIFGQETQNNATGFWEELSKHCGKSYEGKLADGVINKDFEGKALVMHVKSCTDNVIKIPFFVGEDRSRTWVLTNNNGIITLKHDHREEDGSEEKITQYGGTSSNIGFKELQFFPADEHTATLIPYASSNIWWITLDNSKYTYNLKKIESDKFFTVEFDLSKEVATPKAPWGWKD